MLYNTRYNNSSLTWRIYGLFHGFVGENDLGCSSYIPNRKKGYFANISDIFYPTRDTYFFTYYAVMDLIRVMCPMDIVNNHTWESIVRFDILLLTRRF